MQITEEDQPGIQLCWLRAAHHMLPVKLSLTEAGTGEWRWGQGRGRSEKCETLIPNVEKMDFLPSIAASG